MSSQHSQKTLVHDGISYIGASCNLIATFLVCLSMGMTAVLFPVGLEKQAMSTSSIGVIMSLETIASFLICFVLPMLLRKIGMTLGLLSTALIRIPPVLFMVFSQDAILWTLAIFINAAGAFTFLLLTQTWINAINFQNRAVWMAIFSTSMSLGLAAGAALVSHMENSSDVWILLLEWLWLPIGGLFGRASVTITELEFIVSIGFSLLAIVPILIAYRHIPKFSFANYPGIWSTIKQCKGPMYSIAMAGVSMFGVTAFITLYGLKNGLTLTDAALLLTFFNLGAIILEIPIGYIADRFDSRYMIVICSFLCMVCAVYLPIAIYVNYQAWLLVFLWGGVVGAIYSLALTIIGERFNDEELIAANAGYTVMEGAGGTLGILLIGFCMQFLGADGLPYVIMFSAILYFSFALTRYRIV